MIECECECDWKDELARLLKETEKDGHSISDELRCGWQAKRLTYNVAVLPQGYPRANDDCVLACKYLSIRIRKV